MTPTPEELHAAIKHSWNQAGTNYLVQISTNLSFAKANLQAWKREPFVSPRQQKIMAAMLNSMNSALNGCRQILQLKDHAEYKAEVLDDEIVLQTGSVMTMFMALPKELRDVFEKELNTAYLKLSERQKEES